MFKTVLKKNDRLMCSYDLPQDTQNKSNTFTVRRWIPSLEINPGDKLTVAIVGDQGEISVLDLMPARGRGDVYTAKKDTGELYTWATITRGMGMSKGFTSGVMFRKKKKKKDDGC